MERQLADLQVTSEDEGAGGFGAYGGAAPVVDSTPVPDAKEDDADDEGDRGDEAGEDDEETASDAE